MSRPGNAIELCAKQCDDRTGCTAFRFGLENGDYVCKTYTGGKRAITNKEQENGWTSCVKGKLIEIVLT